MSAGTDKQTQNRDFNGWWGATAALVMAVLIGAGYVIWRGSTPAQVEAAPSQTTSAAAATPASSQTSSTPSSGRAVCGATAADSTVPTSAPPSTEWDIVHTVALPRSASAGPAVHSGSTRRCFAHTPTGALFAAVALAVTTDSPGAEDVLRDQVMPGPTRDAQLQSVKANPPQPKQPGETAVISGFRFLSYTPESCVISIAFSFGGRFGAQIFTVQWDEGDWKFDLDPAGGSLPGQPLPDITGYVPWGAT